MPLKKKNKSAKKIIIWAFVIVLIILMFISFPAAQNVTEIVLFP